MTYWVSWGKDIDTLFSTCSSQRPLSMLYYFHLRFICYFSDSFAFLSGRFLCLLILILFCLFRTYIYHVYEIYSGGGPSMYNCGLLLCDRSHMCKKCLCTPLHSCWWFGKPHTASSASVNHSSMQCLPYYINWANSIPLPSTCFEAMHLANNHPGTRNPSHQRQRTECSVTSNWHFKGVHALYEDASGLWTQSCFSMRGHIWSCMVILIYKSQNGAKILHKSCQGRNMVSYKFRNHDTPPSVHTGFLILKDHILRFKNSWDNSPIITNAMLCDHELWFC